MLSIIVAGIFYPQLPSEIAYRFRESAAENTMPLGAFVAWMLAPQVFFVLLAWAIARLMMLAARYAPPGETPLERLLPLMGNMVALPQIILFVAMLQFFLYNAYQTEIIPLWIVALAVLVLGVTVLAVYFVRIIRRFRSRKLK